MLQTIEQAMDILRNKKDHWSHEIADAQQTVICGMDILCSLKSENAVAMREEINDILNEGETE